MCDEKWDELRLVDCKTFLGKESLMESAKYLSGSTQDRFGHRSKSRYGPYPKGLYGFNWLCHQAANAFTSKKWGFRRVVFWPMIFYGFTGNRGISNVKTTCPETHAYLPCVSGAGCCGQCYPALLPPFHGKGYNLKRGWHPAEEPKKEWIKTDFMYEIEHINNCGWDYVPKYAPIPQ